MGRERLTPLDASFLRVETPSAHMHVAWKGRFRPAPGCPPVTLARLRAQVAARLDGAARFRQRLAFPPGGLSEPVWVDDETFSIERHVVALAGDEETITRRRFDELADLVLSEPLNRSRALWRIDVAPRLADGTCGVVMKAHHAMVDGKSALAMALLLLDLDPTATEPPPAREWSPTRPPGRARLALDALADTSAEPLRAWGRAARAARGGGLTGTLRRTALTVGEDVVRAAPSSYVNVPIGPRRTVVGWSAPLGELLELKRARGVSLNDVALAIVAGAMRQLALRRGVSPEPLKVMVPVSRRPDDAAEAMGNRIAFVFITLPVHLHRPLARLEAIHAETNAFKAGGRAAGGEVLLGAIGLLPPALKDRAARMASSPRMYNLVVSNVPGPRTPVYMLGAECVEAFPVVPLSEGHALSIGIFSLHDRLCFSGYADPTALPEVSALPGGLAQAALELRTRAAGPGRQPARAVVAVSAA